MVSHDFSMYDIKQVAAFLSTDIKIIRALAIFFGIKNRNASYKQPLFTGDEVRLLEKLHNSMEKVSFEAIPMP